MGQVKTIQFRNALDVDPYGRVNRCELNVMSPEFNSQFRPVPDSRHVSRGLPLPTEGYSDQPYIIKTDDGAWLCVFTTGSGHEGQPGQHVVTSRSVDRGRTWDSCVDVEPADGPEASYAVLLKASSGRVFCFYNHNTDNVREVVADDPPYAGGICRRVDSQGYFVFKFSDDHGRSWSAERYPIFVRESKIDRENPYGGKIRFFWNVGRPFRHEGSAYVSLHKVGGLGEGFFTRSEGWLLCSEKLDTADDPRKIRWKTLPEGETGLCTPPGGGPIAEEQSYSVMSDGSFFSVYRSIDGHPVCAYSRDQGRSWSEPTYMAYPDGRLIKHPRAANFAWRCESGKYLYWFHNHGGRWYEDRNPVWLCGGVERESPEGRVIAWSQPEIVLYDDDPFVRMSYPDLVEDRGRFFLTETQKHIPRVHEVEPDLIRGLWGQFEAPIESIDGRVLDLDLEEGRSHTIEMPRLPAFLGRDIGRPDQGTGDFRRGVSLGFQICRPLSDGTLVLMDSRARDGRGVILSVDAKGGLEMLFSDGRTRVSWKTEDGVLRESVIQNVTVILDGGPRIISIVVDDQLLDGGRDRQFGWGRFSPHFRGIDGRREAGIGPGIRRFWIYDRTVRISETVSHHRWLERSLKVDG